jgi:hypothetical protein
MTTCVTLSNNPYKFWLLGHAIHLFWLLHANKKLKKSNMKGLQARYFNLAIHISDTYYYKDFVSSLGTLHDRVLWTRKKCFVPGLKDGCSVPDLLQLLHTQFLRPECRCCSCSIVRLWGLSEQTLLQLLHPLLHSLCSRWFCRVKTWLSLRSAVAEPLFQVLQLLQSQSRAQASSQRIHNVIHRLQMQFGLDV